ncbi:MAG TPA: CRISPR-associated helicase Cas3' [Isosphaeraceae bacterium]|nr:CRISPR-associated helicase Cas3' [Isosphaeraceae bacterium]
MSRRALYEACLSKAELPPGGFSLTAPTGSGKTLAMMAFALKHAAVHNLRRVIVVLPFLAIIEQNARVYRDILGTHEDGSSVVLEHHSAVQMERESKEPVSRENESPPQIRAKQATENWDAPVIVTTAVQFLESLFARRPSRCRKLHNIARSVVLFDEVQTLPFPLLDPILSAVRDLRDHFGVSFLFASATQPTFDKSPNLPCGFKPQECREVDENRLQTFSILRRTRLELPFLTEGKWSWNTLAQRIKPEPRALIIVNLRQHAQDLYDLLWSRNTKPLFHLSSTMCTAHREALLGHKKDPASGTIYHALQHNEPCVVVSTQVVEAGVDVDFPIIFRALAPLDAIIQAAGRCDREGRLTLSAGSPAGRVVVVEPDFKFTTPPGFYTEATRKTRSLLTEIADDPDRVLDDPAIFAKYHANLIAWGEGQEQAREIQKACSILGFKTVDSLFRLIDDAGQGVVVRYGEAPAILDRIRTQGYVTRDDRRDLQHYSVALTPTWFSKLQNSLEEVFKKQDQGLWEYTQKYEDEGVGLRLGELPIEEFLG